MCVEGVVCQRIHASGPRLTFRHRFEAFHSAVFPQSAEETEVPHVVLNPSAVVGRDPRDRRKSSSTPLL